MNRRWLVLPAAFLLLTIACSNPETELHAATGRAFADRLSFADQDERTCLADSYMSTLGVDGYASRGIDRKTLRASPDAVDILIEHSSAIVGDCIDLEDRLRRALVPWGGGLAGECVADEQLEADPLFETLLAPEPSLSGMSDDSRQQLLEAIRGCVSEETFARLAGLAHPSELLAVLAADPFARSRWKDDQDPCVNRAVLETLGVQRLDELGVTLVEPEFLDLTFQLADEELDRLTTSFKQCDLKEQIRRAIAVTEEQIAGCVAETIPEDSYGKLVADLFQGRAVTIRAPIPDLVDTCSFEAIDPLFDVQSDPPSDVLLFVRGFALEAATSDSVYERECLTAGLLANLDLDGVNAAIETIEAYNEGELPPQETETAYWALMEEATDVIATCFRPWIVVAFDLSAAGVAEDHLACIRNDAGPAALSTIVNNYGAALWADDWDAWQDLDRGLAVLTEAVEVCASPADTQRWDNYLADNFGYYEDGADVYVEPTDADFSA